MLGGESGSGKTETARLVVDFLSKISQIKRLNRSTTSLGSNRSLNSNTSSRQSTPKHTVSSTGGPPPPPRRIIRARSTENEPLNYGSLKKQGNATEKSVNFDFTKYKSTENLVNHQLLVPKCQIHHHSPVYRPHYRSEGPSPGTISTMPKKTCPKHNPEPKTIVKCDSCMKKSSTGDLRIVKSPTINPHCRVHALDKDFPFTKNFVVGKIPPRFNTSTVMTQTNPKPNLYQLDGLGRRPKTPPPSIQVPNFSGAYHPSSATHPHHLHRVVPVVVGQQTTGNIPKPINRSKSGFSAQCDTTVTNLKTILRGSETAKSPGKPPADNHTMRDRVANAEFFLNAMGNATTQRNWNSSRFGKFFDIEFDFKGDVVGGHISHCK